MSIRLLDDLTLIENLPNYHHINFIQLKQKYTTGCEIVLSTFVPGISSDERHTLTYGENNPTHRVSLFSFSEW